MKLRLRKLLKFLQSLGFARLFYCLNYLNCLPYKYDQKSVTLLLYWRLNDNFVTRKDTATYCHVSIHPVPVFCHSSLPWSVSTEWFQQLQVAFLDGRSSTVLLAQGPFAWKCMFEGHMLVNWSFQYPVGEQWQEVFEFHLSCSNIKGKTRCFVKHNTSSEIS